MANPSACRLWRACFLLREFNFSGIFLHHIVAWPSGNSPTKNHEDRPFERVKQEGVVKQANSHVWLSHLLMRFLYHVAAVIIIIIIIIIMCHCDSAWSKRRWRCELRVKSDDAAEWSGSTDEEIIFICLSIQSISSVNTGRYSSLSTDDTFIVQRSCKLPGSLYRLLLIHQHLHFATSCSFWEFKLLIKDNYPSQPTGCLSPFVCLSVCPEHNSKTKDPKVFKLGVGNELEISYE